MHGKRRGAAVVVFGGLILSPVNAGAATVSRHGRGVRSVAADSVGGSRSVVADSVGGSRSVAAADVGGTPGTTLTAPTVALSPASVHTASNANEVFAFGDAPLEGSLAGRVLNQPIRGMAPTPSGHGYWLVASDGGVFAFGDATFYGSTGGQHLNAPIVGMAPTPSGRGYWLVASDGGVFAFGDATFYGSTGGQHLNAPIVGMAPTPSGRGYWLVASDGGVFAFGDATFYGSTGGQTLNAPIVGMAPTPSGHGYWLVASDGGVFAFGDATFYGSTGGQTLNAPIVGMAPTPSGRGYWLVASDGGVFAFGDATFYGSTGGQHLNAPIVGMAFTPSGHGYWLLQGQTPPPIVLPAPLFSPSLVDALNQRAGVISAAITDLNTGYVYTYRPGQLGLTASIVKVEILGTLLAQTQVQGRPLSATEQSLATSMIELSDNDSATDLWNEVGGAPAVAAFDQSVGMNATVPNAAWGMTLTTPGDQVELLQHLVKANSVLSDASRGYALGLMEHVTPSEAWGVSAGTVPGTTVALKNGWLPVGAAGWTVNSIGWVTGSDRDYLIAVTTAGSPTESYGIDSVSMVASATWAALAP